MLFYERSGKVVEIHAIRITDHKIEDETERAVCCCVVDGTGPEFEVRLSRYGILYPVSSTDDAVTEVREWASCNDLFSVRLYHVQDREDVTKYVTERMVEWEVEG